MFLIGTWATKTAHLIMNIFDQGLLTCVSRGVALALDVHTAY